LFIGDPAVSNQLLSTGFSILVILSACYSSEYSRISLDIAQEIASMVCMLAKETRTEVLRIIQEHSPRPTELLKLLSPKLSYDEIQDALSELLDSGEVVLNSERHLCLRTKAA
jgi:hypothetical protein